ncbi:16S rRNA (guanine(966)-N(2))-methyltransferase RsmD [Carboxydothermus pertinax]|uniref:Methyltransferase n=1 Tax=Carboxydothermus pertinax TaxID=870242 RepID=A0A1L8CXT0_9THEO|nr:16S rRNA (guanine(966)-N(2))-methyltransferase RsmD [Carboxydothermus pertinax]GAV23703.1 methyltransferase [Carboxydothermus pertinax]
MRIITGEARGRKLIAPKGLKTRPTSDRVKESLFNILGSKVFDTMVLDGFAGTGNLGLEALSRGAKFSYFIEPDREAFRCLCQNINNLGYKEKAKAIRGDIFKILPKLKVKFDLIFLDPPYGKGYEQKAITEILRLNLLKENGIIVVETATKNGLCLNYENLLLVREAIYGSTVLGFYHLQ